MRTACTLLAALVALAACGRDPARPQQQVQLERPEQRAAAWLVAQQRDDGAFCSERYAVLRSGQAMTPFVLHALLRAGQRRGEPVERALRWLRSAVGDDGAIGYADPDLVEYPVYATAMALLVLASLGDPADAPRIDAMARWLRAQQCAEARGFAADAPAYGAFGFGAIGLPPGTPGHVDLTHTRFALQALAAAGELDRDVRECALVLLARMQRPDGGFFFSPVVAAANKAGRGDDGAFRPYATATAEGLLALRALGLDEHDARIKSARAWLDRNARADRIGGIDERPAEPWHDALRFYHAMVLADAHPPSRPALRAMLVARQERDGGFRSGLVSAMKEDDPLLATALALHALTARHASTAR